MGNTTTATRGLPVDDEAATFGRWRIALLSLIMFSLLCGVLLVAFRGAIDATPYGEVDSSGRTMGFNDLFSSEHYGLILERMSLEATIKKFGSYELVFVVVHLVAAFVVSFRTRFSGKQIRLFFFLQPIAFPWGIFGLFYSPMYVVRGASLSLDREAFIDVPFIWITSHSIWIVTAVFVGWYFSRRALDDEGQVS